MTRAIFSLARSSRGRNGHFRPQANPDGGHAAPRLQVGGGHARAPAEKLCRWSRGLRLPPRSLRGRSVGRRARFRGAPLAARHAGPYRCYNHPPTYTAQETAHVMHISGHEVAKTVILRVDGRLVMAVLPACEMVDLDRFKEGAGALWVELADEGEFEKLARE